MQDQDQIDRAVIASFAQRKRRQWFGMIPMLISFGGAMFLDFESNPNEMLQTGAGLLIIASVVFGYLNWRCPACNKYLGRAANPIYCRRCYVRLQG